MKEALVRIHARLCGDGCITTYETSEPDRKRRGVIIYTNFVESNLDEFQGDMQDIFGVKMTRREQRVEVKSLRIIRKLQSRFGDLASEQWDIPDSIHNSSDSKKYEWIRAFVRDEGHHEDKYNRLRIKSTNKSGLKDVARLMESLSITTSLTGPNGDGTHYLTVSRVDRFDTLHNIASKKPKIRG